MPKAPPAERLGKQAKGGAARLAHRRLATGQPEPAEMGDPPPSPRFDQQEFAAPHRPVAAIAGAVKGDAEDWRLDAVLGHAGNDMGKVMLHRDDGHAKRFGHARRGVVGMEVACDAARFDGIEPRQVGDRRGMGVASLGSIEVSDMRADHDPARLRHGDRRLEVAADRDGPLR